MPTLRPSARSSTFAAMTGSVALPSTVSSAQTEPSSTRNTSSVTGKYFYLIHLTGVFSTTCTCFPGGLTLTVARQRLWLLPGMPTSNRRGTPRLPVWLRPTMPMFLRLQLPLTPDMAHLVVTRRLLLPPKPDMAPPPTSCRIMTTSGSKLNVVVDSIRSLHTTLPAHPKYIYLPILMIYTYPYPFERQHPQIP